MRKLRALEIEHVIEYSEIYTSKKPKYYTLNKNGGQKEFIQNLLNDFWHVKEDKNFVGYFFPEKDYLKKHYKSLARLIKEERKNLKGLTNPLDRFISVFFSIGLVYKHGNEYLIKRYKVYVVYEFGKIAPYVR